MDTVRYNSVSRVLKQKYGKKVYKLALQGGITCPNRDGTCGTRGCIFCEGGSGAFSEDGDVKTAIQTAKNRVKSKGAEVFIAYFQSYTSTYLPTDVLRQKLLDACDSDVVEIYIATRPDCLGDEILEILDYVNQIKPITVELGLQTMHDKTAEYIRRGYKTKVYEKACERLHGLGIAVVTHCILYLPNESEKMMLDTVRFVAERSDGIKLQILHVLKNTDLLSDYEKGLFTLPTLDEYVAFLAKCVEILPPDTVIHRITGDGAKKTLVAPLWSADKKRVLNTISAYFEKHDIKQGKRY